MRIGFLLLCLAALAAAPALLRAEEVQARSAGYVVIRGKRTLEQALAAVVNSRTLASKTHETVLFIVDVTPYTGAARGRLAKALASLDEVSREGMGWRIARLGEAPTPAVTLPSRLGALLDAVFSRETSVTATIPALERTITALPEEGASVVYLADWHFEDDIRLERFIRHLRKAGHVFHVIGSEAAFTRGWNDGLFPPNRGEKLPNGFRRLYADGIGRSPFGQGAEEAPWHGGDTAWPHLPLYFGGGDFVTQFPVRLPPLPGLRDPLPEDLDERKGRPRPKGRGRTYYYPLPSGFGPYPLMRAAAVTGGRYVLFSWNPTGRSDLTYNYSTCNHFAPDLRSRSEILADVRRRPLAMALIRAWHWAAEVAVAVATVTPPLTSDLRCPLPMEEAVSMERLDFSWARPTEHKRFLKTARVCAEDLASAIAALDRGLRSEVKDEVDRRYRADATLLRHILLVKRFHVLEALGAAEDLDRRSAWLQMPLQPLLRSKTFIKRASESERMLPERVKLFHLDKGAQVLHERKVFLVKYAGTPYAELVGRNRVVTYEVVWRDLTPKGGRSRRSPAESSGTGPTTTPPGGGSSPGGPTTGG